MFVQRLHEGVSVEIQDSPVKVFMVQLSRKATLHPAPRLSETLLSKVLHLFPKMPASQRPKLVVLTWGQSLPPRG